MLTMIELAHPPEDDDQMQILDDHLFEIAHSSVQTVSEGEVIVLNSETIWSDTWHKIVAVIAAILPTYESVEILRGKICSMLDAALCDAIEEKESVWIPMGECRELVESWIKAAQDMNEISPAIMDESVDGREYDQMVA